MTIVANVSSSPCARSRSPYLFRKPNHPQRVIRNDVFHRRRKEEEDEEQVMTPWSAERGRPRKAQWGKLSGRGDAISAAEEGHGTGKPEGRPMQAGRRLGEHGRALEAPSHACAGQRASRMGRKQAGVAGAALKEKRRRRGVRRLLPPPPKVFRRQSTLTGGKFKWHFQG